MKRTGFIILALAVSIYLWGCGKKEPSSEELAQEPMSMETLSLIGTTETKTLPEMKPEVKVQAAAAGEQTLEPLPPSGPYRPTASEIQTALVNAGYYAGPVDAKIGPKTKKAIEDFQKANNLAADGKVGPKTWAALSSYLNAAAGEPAKARTAAKKR